MLLLTSTSDKIQLITGSAGAIDVHTDYADLAAGVVTTGRLNTKPTTATTTDIVASPAASTSRNVKSIYAQNVHASTSNLCTIQHTDGTNVVVLESVTLAPGERIQFVEGQGFTQFDAAGLPKVNPAIIAGQLLTARLGATVSNSTTTAAKITGLDLALPVGTWVFEYWLRFQSSLATTGPKLSVNHSGTVTSFMVTVMSLTAGTLDSTGALDQDATAMQIMGGMAQRAKLNTAALIATAGVDTVTADNMIKIEGMAVVTVAGNLELWHASETANSTSIMQDSVVRATKS